MKRRASFVLCAAVAALSIVSLCYAAPSCCEGPLPGSAGGVSLQPQGFAGPPTAPVQLRQAAGPDAVRRWVAPTAAARYVTPMMYGQPYANAPANCCGQPGSGAPAPTVGCCGRSRVAQSAPAPGCCGQSAGSQAPRQGSCCGSTDPAQGSPAGGCCGPLAAPQAMQRGGGCGAGQAPCGCSGNKAVQRPATPAPSSLPPCCVPGAAATNSKPAAIPAVNVVGAGTAPDRVGPVRQAMPVAVMNISAPSREKAVQQVGRPWPQTTDTLW